MITARKTDCEVHCDHCGFAMFEGEAGYSEQDEDGSLVWYCEEHADTERLARLALAMADRKLPKTDANLSERSGFDSAGLDIWYPWAEKILRKIRDYENPPEGDAFVKEVYSWAEYFTTPT